MLGGVNLAATAAVVAATDVPVIASGGVGGLDDIRGCKKIGCGGVIVGRPMMKEESTCQKHLKLPARKYKLFLLHSVAMRLLFFRRGVFRKRPKQKALGKKLLMPGGMFPVGLCNGRRKLLDP